MNWERAREAVPRLEVVAQTGSTNDDIRAALTGANAGAWSHGSTLVTDDQTAGRGRLGRVWMAPTGKTLAISTVVRPREVNRWLSPDALGWVPLIAGAAMTEAVANAVARAAERVERDDEDGPGRREVGLKWPNDVQIAGYKVSGILSEFVSEASAVIVGAGLNLTLDEHDLPTLTSTSLLLATGEAPDADEVLADYLRAFLAGFDRFAAADGDAEASGIAGWVSSYCQTLGTDVRVILPDDSELVGLADRLDVTGRLVVIDRESGEHRAVAAGDVTHLRY
ncbi:MAG TPA: biotin--[acetyl-CoA-carboxylase] ligase [Candidatus Lumbricidophila sp.]|nr:biotin--[acetyl-CoA-carboxylase] ligase [Candidatus Lumbricidophila sp.]